MSRFRVCPNCGMELKPNAIACPHCGSDENTGWKEAAWGASPEVDPFDVTDYSEALAREFGKPKPAKKPFPWRSLVAGTLIFVLVVLRLFWK